MSGEPPLDGIDRAIAERYAQGESGVRLAADFGISRSHLNHVLKQAGIPRRRQPTLSSMTPEMREQIIRAHRAGLSGNETSYLAGVAMSLVYLVWRSEGLRRQPTQKIQNRQSTPAATEPRKISPEIRDAWIETQYRDGLSMDRIAASVGLGRTSVSKVLKARGVPTRPPVKYQKLTEGEQEAAAARYVQGMSLDEVAAEFGVAQATIGECLRRQGVKPRTDKRWVRKLSSDQEADLVVRYQAGEAVDVLEKRFGVIEGTILAVVRRAGQPTRKPGKPGKEISPEQAIEIVRRYAAWESVAKIALDFGIARNRVVDVAAAGGVERRRPRRAKGSVKRRGGRRDRASASGPIG